MGIKIWWQDIMPSSDRMMKDLNVDLKNAKETYDRLFLENLKKVAGQDTVIDVHPVKQSSYMIEASYMELLNNVQLIDGIIEAEKQGYDAAIIGCANDPGLQQARQAVDIPVIGVTEASMHLACMLGHKFGVITVMDRLVSVCERNIHSYGLDYRATMPVRVFNVGKNAVQGMIDMILKPETINPQFEELCLACIADGAEVIIPACVALSPAASLLNFTTVAKTGVPVMDVTQVAVKMAELQVELKRTVGLGKSQRNWYRSLKTDNRNHFRDLVNK
ncbi:aspartate/glutamate racemase family protein [bacterium]|nr:aspartate/glutamate racemase family protein [bacterium]